MALSPVRKKMILTALCVLGFAIVHFIVSFFVSFAAGISSHDSGGSLFMVASKILTFPLWLIPGGANSASEQTLLSWWPWATLSLAWGGLITRGLYLLRR